MEELKDDNQKMTLAFEQLQRDHDKLKEDEVGKSKKLQEFQLLNEHREQAKQDLKGKEYHNTNYPEFQCRQTNKNNNAFMVVILIEIALQQHLQD